MNKKLLRGLLIGILLFSVSFTAIGTGQVEVAYPQRPVDFLIPFGAGGSADVMGRVLVEAAEPYFGQPFVPINKPGAGGGIMYTALKNSKADGYTVGWNSTSVLTATNIGNVPFTYEAFTHVCRIGFTAMPIAVLADSPWKTAAEFLRYAKQNPGKVKIGNAGTGSATHLTAVITAVKAGIDVVHVPLGAKRRIPSLLGGEVEAICVPLPEAAPHVQAGTVRLLAMPTESRDPSFPDVPTLKELGYDVVIELFRGISIPQGTPEDAIAALEKAFEQASKDPKFVEVAKKNGFNIDFKGRADFEAYLKVQDKLIAEGMKIGGLVQ